jgi:EasF-like predicted methyltransferase
MKKTELLLHTLQGQQKRVEYFACDVDESALRRGISELRARFEGSSPYITIHGLLGTYEDCAAWLKLKSGALPTLLIWLGNSMANFTPEQASKYVQSFLSSGSSMIIALDGCQDQREIAESYEGQCNREFILNGFSNANQILDDDVFAVNDWGFEGKWNPDLCMHESFYVAQRDLTVNACGETYRFKSGETMRSIRSGKWPRAKVLEICNNAGGRVKELWMNENQSYGMLRVSIPACRTLISLYRCLCSRESLISSVCTTE